VTKNERHQVPDKRALCPAPASGTAAPFIGTIVAVNPQRRQVSETVGLSRRLPVSHGLDPRRQGLPEVSMPRIIAGHAGNDEQPNVRTAASCCGPIVDATGQKPEVFLAARRFANSYELDMGRSPSCCRFMPPHRPRTCHAVLIPGAPGDVLPSRP